MSNDTQKTKTNESSSPVVVKQTPTGLILASVATIAVSWGGMAAYMDYRLTQMESGIEQQGQTVTEAVSEDMQNQYSSLKNSISNSIDENSSVLAKGILELTNQEEQHFQKSLSEMSKFSSLIKGNRDVISQSVKKVLENNQSQIKSLLDDKLQNTEKELVNQFANLQNTQLEQSKSLYDALQSSYQKNSNAMTSTLETIDTNVKETKSVVNTGLVQTTKSLDELANRYEGEFQTLAARMESLSNHLDQDTKQLTAELNNLNNRVQTVRSELGVTQSNIDKLAPSLNQASQKQLKLLGQTSDQVNKVLKENIQGIQEKITKLSEVVDDTTQNLMKAMNVTKNGLEDSTVELKSELVMSQEYTTNELKKLSLQVEEITQSLNQLMASKKNDSLGQLTAPLDRSEGDSALEHFSTELTNLNSDIASFEDRLQKKVQFAREAIKQQLEYGAEKNQSEFLTDVANSFDEFSEEINKYFDSISSQLQSIKISAADDSTSQDESEGITSSKSESKDSNIEEGISSAAGVQSQSEQSIKPDHQLN